MYLSLNGVNITQSADHYNYRAILETLLSYGVDASISHLTVTGIRMRGI